VTGSYVHGNEPSGSLKGVEFNGRGNISGCGLCSSIQVLVRDANTQCSCMCLNPLKPKLV
jgi:hypothetical protein